MIGLGELLIVVLIALVVINPKDYPKIAHFIGSKIAQMRRYLFTLSQPFWQTKDEEE